MKSSKQVVELKPLLKKTVKVKIKGTSNFLYGRFAKTSIDNIKEKDAGKARIKTKIRDIEKEVKESTYFMENGDFGFPASGFQSGMVDIANQLGLFKKDTKGMIKVLGLENGLIPIKCESHKINERIIPRVGTIKYSTELIGWSCELNILFDSSVVTLNQIIDLLNRAGFHRGLGSFSPKNSGTYRMYEVVIEKKKEGIEEK